MSVIVRDTGFEVEDWHGDVLDLSPDADLGEVRAAIGEARVIRVGFPSFSDGRGFTVARRLRQMGYLGRLRAYGHIIADQYAMARRCGFDEVEIDEQLSRRQPEEMWRRGRHWQADSYLSRLKRLAAA